MLETSKPEWHQNSWWGVMMINFYAAGDTNQEQQALPKHKQRLIHTQTRERVSNLSREHLPNLLWCFYHSVFDPIFLLCVSTLELGQFKWPGAASSERLTQQPSSNCVLTNTTIICNKLLCFFTLQEGKYQISYPIFIPWIFWPGVKQSHHLAMVVFLLLFSQHILFTMSYKGNFNKFLVRSLVSQLWGCKCFRINSESNDWCIPYSDPS